ncbi:MAG: histidine phosphatase family protein [Bacilli bacterium]|nr:histidine phosphatase family protein [Bacilli bacterium]
MKITLVRHGETEENYEGKILGRKNVLLNETGRRQALRLKNNLSALHYDLCFTSPFIRCFETALVAVGDRVEIIRDDRIQERDMGELEGRPVEEYNAFQFWNYDKNRSDYGVEPVQDILERCEDFLNEIKEKYPDKSILIVTHSGTYRALRHLIKKDPLKGNLLDGKIPNGSYEEFEI